MTARRPKTEDTTAASETTASPEEEKYAQALALLESRKYEEAKALFEELGDYQDAKEHLSKFQYFPTLIEFRLSDVSGKLEVILNEDNMPVKTVAETTNPGKVGELTYDEQGRVIRHTVTTDGEGTVTREYTYDANGNLTKLLETDANGEWYATYWKYNEKGLVFEDYGESAEGIDYVTTTEYDENGNCTDVKCVSAGEEIFSFEYIYDANGYRTRRIQIVMDGDPSITDFTYDANGNVIKEVYTNGSDGAVTSTVEYTYDENGNQTKGVYADAEGYSETITYTYDENGNRIKIELTNVNGEVQKSEVEYVLVYIPFVLSEEEMENLASFWEEAT